MQNFCVWFEIPVKDFNRAKKFYSEIFQVKIEQQQMGDDLMGFLPMKGYANSGAIVQGEGYIPSDKGALIYFNGGDDLKVIQDRIRPAGGKVIMEKRKISDDIGFMSIFLDTEGNRLALHSRN